LRDHDDQAVASATEPAPPEEPDGTRVPTEQFVAAQTRQGDHEASFSAAPHTSHDMMPSRRWAVHTVKDLGQWRRRAAYPSQGPRRAKHPGASQSRRRRDLRLPPPRGTTP
jgi:hypothetical protein